MLAMKIHYRLDVDSVNYDDEMSGIENVVYKANYTLWVWTGNKDLNKELDKGHNGEIHRNPPNVIRTSFGVDFEAPKDAEGDFVEIDDLSESILIKWMLDKWNHETIHDLHAFKSLVNSLKANVTKNKIGFPPTQGAITV